MAKKKRTKKDKEKNSGIIIDLFGFLLVLLCILGIGKYGLAGRVVASFSIFLVGSLYLFLLVFLLILGIVIIVKREKINPFSTKMIGVYIFAIGLLVLLHQNYINSSTDIIGDIPNLVNNTLDNLMDAMDRIMNSEIKTGIFNIALPNTGGGILGAIFAWIFYSLFDAAGTKIAVWILLIMGFSVFTGFSIRDILKSGKDKLMSAFPKDKKERKVSSDDMSSTMVGGLKINDNTVVEEEKQKVVYTDLDKIKNIGKEENVVVSSSKEEIVTNTNYLLPDMKLLDLGKKVKQQTNHKLIEENIVKLEKVLKDFGILGNVVEVNIGPTVTQYELSLQSGTKVSRLLGINREIALALQKKDVRIQAPIPGKGTVGVEMPNDVAQMVTLRETLEAMPKSLLSSLLSVALGKDIMGKVKWCEIPDTPHLLIAGATGSGKSVCINGIIVSILMKSKPDEVKMILIDPKKVELSVYNGVPHLLTPVVTDPRKASIALKKAVSEMERRYDLFEENKTKNITSYNKLIEDKNKNLSEEDKLKRLPYIVVVVDELADLMLVAKNEVEDSILRITQMARAAGIHLIVATQRPSTDVITGLIKANIPSRIAFAVSNGIDSRTILDCTGADKLLGRGDMLYLPMGESAPTRIQGAYISEEEIKKIVDHTVDQQKAQYDDNFLKLEAIDQELKNGVSLEKEEYDDPLYNEIVEFVVTSGKASASLLQRKYKLGYNRAARIVDLLEERGIIGPQNGSKPREVLVKLDDPDYE